MGSLRDKDLHTTMPGSLQAKELDQASKAVHIPNKSKQSANSNTDLTKEKDGCSAEAELRKVLTCSESRNWEACPFVISSDFLWKSQSFEKLSSIMNFISTVQKNNAMFQESKEG